MANKKESDCTALEVFKCSANDFEFSKPDIDEELSSKVCKEIENAWKGSSFLDNKGWIWVREDRLHSILRTTKGNALYYIDRLYDKDKMTVGNFTYVRGIEIIKLIYKRVEECGALKTEKYLSLSKKYYDSIRESDKAKVLKGDYIKLLWDTKKRLKKHRIRRYNIDVDELTLENLDIKTAEFSHIRSVAIYPEYSSKIENGLIINKETHKFITSKNINDEEELFELCEDMGWSIAWYDPFKEFFEF